MNGDKIHKKMNTQMLCTYIEIIESQIERSQSDFLNMVKSQTCGDAAQITEDEIAEICDMLTRAVYRIDQIKKRIKEV